VPGFDIEQRKGKMIWMGSSKLSARSAFKGKADGVSSNEGGLRVAIELA
jgi:hypothetical protein